MDSTCARSFVAMACDPLEQAAQDGVMGLWRFYAAERPPIRPDRWRNRKGLGSGPINRLERRGGAWF
jgi:hypothetical protein